MEKKWDCFNWFNFAIARLGFEDISSVDAIPFLDERSLKMVPGRIKAKLCRQAMRLAQTVPS
jgi:hypothetical protein